LSPKLVFECFGAFLNPSNFDRDGLEKVINAAQLLPDLRNVLPSLVRHLEVVAELRPTFR
jgi:hypothetical protein